MSTVELESEPVSNYKPLKRKHGHYFRVCRYRVLDFYRIADLFGIHDATLQHIIKKALAAGKRGSKDFRRDLEDMRDTLNRRLEMLDEDEMLDGLDDGTGEGDGQ